jgi:uncharacterized membrane protein
MEHEETVTISAPVERVWAVMADVERWPEWTASISSVSLVGDAPLGVGSQVRIKQPGFPAVVWTVDDWRPNVRFTWLASSPGVDSVGNHEVALGPDGTTRVTLRIRQTGPAVWLLRLLFARRTRRYVHLEAEGLKHATES